MARPSRPQPSYVSPDGIPRTLEQEFKLNDAFKHVFSGAAGEEVIAYLRSISILNVSGPKIEPTELVHLEGQRFLCAIIEQRVHYGKAGIPRKDNA